MSMFTICLHLCHIEFKIVWYSLLVRRGQEGENNMNKWKVMVYWEGIEDTHTEEYDGVEYDTREEARKVLIEGNIYFLKEA